MKKILFCSFCLLFTAGSNLFADLEEEGLFYKKFLANKNEPLIIFDVGANIGNWTQVVQSFSGNSYFYAFEPNPKSYQKLKILYKNNNLINTFNMGLSNIVQQDITFYSYRNSELDGLYDRDILRDIFNLTPKEIKVKITTLDAFCEKNNIEYIDILKIDTEGEEYNIILGAKNMIESGSIKLIQFEYGGCFIDAGTKLEWVYNMLKENDYEIYKLPIRGVKTHITEWSPELEDYEWTNYIAIKN